MKAVYALYPDPLTAERAVDGLRAAGIADTSIVVMSSEPLDEYEFGRRDKATWLPWIAASGGVLGLCFGYWLTATTSELWPLRTGGMPIVAIWPHLIIMFELAMLGAISATVITFIVSARLGGRMLDMYDPEIANGQILIGVERPSHERLDEVKRALEVAGRGRLKALD